MCSLSQSLIRIKVVESVLPQIKEWKLSVKNCPKHIVLKEV